MFWFRADFRETFVSSCPELLAANCPQGQWTLARTPWLTHERPNDLPTRNVMTPTRDLMTYPRETIWLTHKKLHDLPTKDLMTNPRETWWLTHEKIHDQPTRDLITYQQELTGNGNLAGLQDFHRLEPHLEDDCDDRTWHWWMSNDVQPL